MNSTTTSRSETLVGVAALCRELADLVAADPELLVRQDPEIVAHMVALSEALLERDSALGALVAEAAVTLWWARDQVVERAR